MIRFTGLSLGLFLRVMTPSIRRLFTALRAHSDTAFIPRHSLYIHASLIIKGTVGLEPTFLPDFFLPCSPFELRSLWRIICPPLANLVYGGKDASHARFQPPLSVLMYRPDKLASQSPGHFALKLACWYTVVARIELALDGSKPSALTIWLYHLIFFQLVPRIPQHIHA